MSLAYLNNLYIVENSLDICELFKLNYSVFSFLIVSKVRVIAKDISGALDILLSYTRVNHVVGFSSIAGI